MKAKICSNCNGSGKASACVAVIGKSYFDNSPTTIFTQKLKECNICEGNGIIYIKEKDL